jgi:AraC-type DNA-binding domain-containing proteins
MDALDFDILWVSRCDYKPRHVVKMNFHDFFQVVFVFNGEGIICVDGVERKTEINQLYIIRPFVKHMISASSGKPLNTVELKFYCSDEYTNQMLHILPQFIEKADSNIRGVFVGIIEEIKGKNSYFKEIIKSQLSQIFYYVYRGCTNQFNNQTSEEMFQKGSEKHIVKSEVVQEAIRYINENYSSEIKLNDLAEHVHLNPGYFCSVFKEEYGISPIHYLQMIRLENAKNMLANSNQSITDIANQVGFQSIHYFSRFFKANVGLTPNDFRHRNQGFICVDFLGNYTDFS